MKPESFHVANSEISILANDDLPTVFYSKKCRTYLPNDITVLDEYSMNA